MKDDTLRDFLLETDDSLTCKVCGAVGFAHCDTRKHVATLASFAAMNSREHRIFSMRIARGEDL